MAKLRIKGVFDVVVNDNAQIAININHNGLPGYIAAGNDPTDGIITFENNTGTTIPVIQDPYCSDAQIDLMQAYDAVYERRRVAWVKLRFIPKYTNFIQSIAEGDPPDESLTGFTNEIVYVVSDSNGLNGRAGAVTDVQQLLANNTGVKIKKLNREFKVFRRSRSIPFAPKYGLAANSTTAVSALTNPSGQWLDTTSINSNNTPHTWIMTAALPMVAGVDLFTCVFEVKFVWADYRTVA